jgi:6-phosphogluconolactonase
VKALETPGAARMETRGAIKITESAGALTLTLATDIVDMAAKAVADHGSFTFALSGGNTPKALYKAFAQAPLKYEMPWKKTYFFFGDERCVPRTSSESNYAMVKETMFTPVPVRSENIFGLVDPDVDPKKSAGDYEAKIRKHFDLEPGELPRFDLILLGLGDDGHTASLFPDSDALKETERLCVENFVKKLDTNRITMTLPVINNAKNVVFLVSGNGKAEVVSHILGDKKEEVSYPAQLVKPTRGNLKWYLDRDAASRLDLAECKS